MFIVSRLVRTPESPVARRNDPNDDADSVKNALKSKNKSKRKTLNSPAKKRGSLNRINME